MQRGSVAEASTRICVYSYPDLTLIIVSFRGSLSKTLCDKYLRFYVYLLWILYFSGKCWLILSVMSPFCVTCVSRIIIVVLVTVIIIVIFCIQGALKALEFSLILNCTSISISLIYFVVQ
jgi:hypothetical protein